MRPRDGDRSRLPHSPGRGIALAAGTAAISGVAVYLNSFAVRELPDATVFTTLKNGVAALLLVGIVLATPAARRAIPTLSVRQWAGLATIGLVGGSIPFILFFNGLAMASAPSAAFIHKTLFIWVALLAVPLLGERVGRPQLVALAVLLGSQLLIQPPTGVTWGSGETFIALATGLWAIEVILARRLLQTIPSGVGAAGRMALGLIVLAGFVLASGRGGVVASLTASQWLWVIATGVLLTGYVATWYAALQHAPATVVAAVLVAGAPLTATLAAIGNGTLPAPGVIGGQGLLLVGVIAIVWFALRRPRLLPTSG